MIWRAKNLSRVLAGDLPAAVTRNVERFLSLIRARRRWLRIFRLSIVPESRIKRSDTVLIPAPAAALWKPNLNAVRESGAGAGTVHRRRLHASVVR